MQAARAARAVDQIIHHHLQDWDHDGSRYTFEEDGARFTLLTWYVPNPPAMVTTGAPKDTPHIAIQAEATDGTPALPYEYRGGFGCTSDRIEEMALWVKDFVEMNLSLKDLVTL